MKVRGEIQAVGLSWPHPANEHGQTWTVTGWSFVGGDFPAVDLTQQRVCGWTATELALVADLARSVGADRAMDRANRYRESLEVAG